MNSWNGEERRVFRRSLAYIGAVSLAALSSAAAWEPVVGLDVLVMGLCASLQFALRRAVVATRRFGPRLQSLSSALWLILLVSGIDFLSRMPWGESVRGILDQTPLRVAQLVAIGFAVAFLERAVRQLVRFLMEERQRNRAALQSLVSESMIEVQRIAPPGPETESGNWRQLVHVLEEEIRIPLNSLRQVGSRLQGMSEEQLRSAAEAVRDESERLDHLLQDFLEDKVDPVWTECRARLTPILEALLSGHRSLLKALDVRVRVQLCQEDEELDIDRATLLHCLTALLGHTLQQGIEGNEAVLRVRQYAGLTCLELRAGSARAATEEASAEVERARELLSIHGGESWLLEDEAGFGVTVPGLKKLDRAVLPKAALAG